MLELSKQYDVHPKFRLDGLSYTNVSLCERANDLVEYGESYEKQIGKFLLDWLNDKNHVNVHTSGSTGTPKVLKVRKIFMINSAKATAQHFRIFQESTALLCLPASYIAGKMMLVRAIVLGWHIDLVQPRSNPLLNINRSYDFCAMTPLQLDNSLSSLHLISKLIVGGGAISPILKSNVQGHKTRVYETYGMTETVTHIAARRINPKVIKEATIPFKVLDNITIKSDNRGCLVINAPLVSSDLIITNDLVQLIGHKKFLWLGRIDNVINSGGIKLFPEQIEAKLASLVNSPFFVIGIPDIRLGEKLTLFVEQETVFSLEISNEEKLLFDAFEIPKQVVTVRAFQRTDSGKIQRSETLKNYLKRL